MQLNKIKLHSCTTFASAQSQITLDDDYNVPDYRPDIVKVLKEKGELQFDEVKAAAGAAWLKGRLVFKVLYRSDQDNAKISCLKGEIPFQEKLNMDGVQEYDVIQASGEIEDLTIGVIHSRKISVRAVILLKTEEPREKEDELCVGIEADDGCETLSEHKYLTAFMYEARSVPPEKRDHTAVKQTQCAGNFMEKLRNPQSGYKNGAGRCKTEWRSAHLRFVSGGRGNRPRAVV